MKDPISLTSVCPLLEKRKKRFAHCGFELLVIIFLVDYVGMSELCGQGSSCFHGTTLLSQDDFSRNIWYRLPSTGFGYKIAVLTKSQTSC